MKELAEGIIVAYHNTLHELHSKKLIEVAEEYVKTHEEVIARARQILVDIERAQQEEEVFERNVFTPPQGSITGVSVTKGLTAGDIVNKIGYIVLVNEDDHIKFTFPKGSSLTCQQFISWVQTLS